METISRTKLTWGHHHLSAAFSHFTQVTKNIGKKDIYAYSVAQTVRRPTFLSPIEKKEDWTKYFGEIILTID